MVFSAEYGQSLDDQIGGSQVNAHHLQHSLGRLAFGSEDYRGFRGVGSLGR